MKNVDGADCDTKVGKKNITGKKRDPINYGLTLVNEEVGDLQRSG